MASSGCESCPSFSVFRDTAGTRLSVLATSGHWPRSGDHLGALYPLGGHVVRSCGTGVQLTAALSGA
jgi:hypothetical protein